MAHLMTPGREATSYGPPGRLVTLEVFPECEMKTTLKGINILCGRKGQLN